MGSGMDLVLGVAVLAVAVSIAGWTSILTTRFARGGAMLESMMQRSFLPEKQRTYLRILSVEGSMLLLAGLTWGLLAAGVLTAGIGDLLIASFLTTGMLAVGAITWLGLKPSRLTVMEQVHLRNRALCSLVLAPLVAD